MAYLILMVMFLAGIGLCGSVVKCIGSQKFSFHRFFSLLYGITFFAGIPFSLLLAFQFDYVLPNIPTLLQSFAVIFGGYLCYLAGYLGVKRKCPMENIAINFPNAKKVALLTACFLLLLANGALSLFLYLNGGFLLFKLEKYSQIFSPIVQGIPLKRFFYFFLPALIILFLMKPTKKCWWLFLAIGTLFGFVSYLAVGGTRANIALAGVFFILLGLQQNYFANKGWKFTACLGTIGLIAMFGLALWRYDLSLNGREAWHTFLYLSRDTFSPWENMVKVVESNVEFQGLMPIIRDFYVYIPQSLWTERPDIVWNSANYFTKIVLGNQSGLAISPTLLGSLYIMGGYVMIGVAMFSIGAMIALFDRAFYRFASSPVIQAYCLGNIFNFIVLVREGLDAFVSRWAFFSLVFLCAYGLATQAVKIGRKNDK